MSKKQSLNVSLETNYTKSQLNNKNKSVTLKNNSKDRTANQGHKKIIKGYQISFSSDNMLGKSIHGQLRMGYNEEKNKVVVFRINTLPLSSFAKSNLQLQEKMSYLKDCSPQIYTKIDSHTNRYTVSEYFPKTFKTQLETFRKSTKILNQLLQKFLIVYSKLYYLRINHGNITLGNVGITFDGKIRLMDFRESSVGFQEGAKQDYEDFRAMMCTIMLRNRVFPDNLACLDDANGNWQQLFSLWHIVNPYQYIYVSKKNCYQNITVMLQKIQNSIVQCPTQGLQHLQIAIRCLILQNLLKLSEQTPKKSKNQIQKLKQILSPIFNNHNQKHTSQLISYYNSILWGFIIDPEHYGLTYTHRLALVSCFFEEFNHQYLFVEILKQLDYYSIYMHLKSEERQLSAGEMQILMNNRIHKVLSENWLKFYPQHIKSRLINAPYILKIYQLPSTSLYKPTKSQINHNISFTTSLLDRSNSQKFKRRQNLKQRHINTQFLSSKNHLNHLNQPLHRYTKQSTHTKISKNISIDQNIHYICNRI